MKNSKTKFTRERQSYKVLKEYEVPVKNNSNKNNSNSKKEEGLFISLLGIIFGYVALYLLNAYIIKCAWNNGVVQIFEGTRPITLIQSSWLYLLSSCLFHRNNLTTTSKDN